MSQPTPPASPHGINDVFISYSRKDYAQVRRVYDRLVAQGRTVWMDEGNIPYGEELPRAIHPAIEAAAVFLFFISPDSVAADSWPLREFEHASRFKKKRVTVLCREVEDSQALEPFRKIREIFWINGQDSDVPEEFFRKLSQTIDEDLEWSRAHARLLRQAREWEERARDGNLLLKGTELARTNRAVQGAAGREPFLHPLQEEFLRASEVEQARSSALRLAEQAEQVARQPGLLQLSILLAVESLRLQANALAGQVLQRGLMLMPRPLVRMHEAGGIIAFDPSGRLLATVSTRRLAGGLWDYQVHVWEVPGGRHLALLPHTHGVRAAAFSADGSRLLTVSDEPAVRLWEVPSGQLLGQVMAGMGTAHGHALHPEGRWLALAGCTVVPHSGGGFVDELRWQGWSMVQGREFERWDLAEGVEGLSSSPDGRWLLGTRGRTLVLREVSTQRELSLPLSESMGPRAFSADGRFLALVEGEDTVLVYETSTGRLVARRVYSPGIQALTLHPDGGLLALAGEDDSLWVGEVSTGKELLRLVLEEPVDSLAFSPDGSHLMTLHGGRAAHRAFARVWRVSSGKEAVRVTDIRSARFSPDGRLATESHDNGVWLWALDTVPEPVGDLRHQDAGEERRGIRAAAFHRNGQHLATAGSDGTVRLWDVNSLGEVARLPHETGVSAVTFDPEGKWLGALTQDHTVSVWNVPEARRLARLSHGTAWVRAWAFSPDGKHLATGGDDQSICLWDLAQVQQVKRLLHEARVWALCFNADGTYLAAVSGPSRERPFHQMARAGDSAYVWDVRSERAMMCVRHEPPRESSFSFHPDVHAVALSPDGRLLATASKDRTVRLWEVPGGTQRARLEHAGSVSALAFSPDGRYLATADEQAARLWELPTGQMVARMHHGDRVLALAFDSEGKYLATTCADRTVRNWLVPEGLEVARRTDGAAVSNTVAFSPDRRRLAMVCSDDAVRLWFWEADWMRTEASLRLTRNLSHEEWRQHFRDEEYRKTCSHLPEGPA